jgi:hypothetical protein
VTGCVIDSANAPVAGAFVMLPELSLLTSSDFNGRHIFIVKKPGTYILCAQKGGKEKTEDIVVTEDLGRIEKDLQLLL